MNITNKQNWSKIFTDDVKKKKRIWCVRGIHACLRITTLMLFIDQMMSFENPATGEVSLRRRAVQGCLTWLFGSQLPRIWLFWVAFGCLAQNKCLTNLMSLFTLIRIKFWKNLMNIKKKRVFMIGLVTLMPIWLPFKTKFGSFQDLRLASLNSTPL